ncbi:MAG: nucleotide-binding protein [Methanoregulaceae archaeon]
MKIGTFDIRVSLLTIVVVVILAFLMAVASVFSESVRSQLYWMIPVLILVFLMPVALNYMSRREYAELVPVYEVEAKPVRIRMINESMLGKVVRIEGVVEKVHFQFLNRPQYRVADRTGEISVKMFTSPDEDIRENDVVEILGSVIQRYVVTGDPVINCVSIRKRADKPVSPENKA